MRPGVSEADLRFGSVDMGDVETSVSAVGRVAPAFEEIITSPISSRVLEVYRIAGDSVGAGDPLLRLDLESTETNIRRLNDQHSIQVAGKEKIKVAASTAISNLEMQIRVSEMTIEKLREDMLNEQRLDSIGSGTGERIRQARLAYETAVLQLEHLRQQLANERRKQEAEILTQDLNISIAATQIKEMERTLADAKIKAPRGATLTYIINEVGRQINAGEKIAVIADLHHFKVEGEIPDAHANKFGVGSRAMVKLGKRRFDGVVSNIVPQSQGGVIKFAVALDDDSDPQLRAGQTAQTYILTDIKEGVLRIPSGAYYSGPGTYSLFVKEGDRLHRRDVTLGDANYDYVEVISGLNQGETVNLSDLKRFENNRTLSIK